MYEGCCLLIHMFRRFGWIVPDNFLSSNVVCPHCAFSFLFNCHNPLGFLKVFTLLHIHKTMQASCSSSNVFSLAIRKTKCLGFVYLRVQWNTYLPCASWCVRRAASDLCGEPPCWQWQRIHWSAPPMTLCGRSASAPVHSYELRIPRALSSYPPDVGS